MKQKPVFKNITKGRIQIIQKGIPIWMNPGDIIVGESFRAFLSMGLKEVGAQEASVAKPTPPPVKPAVNDPEPEKAPIKVRELKMVDVMLPRDELAMSPKVLLPEPEPVVVEPVEEEATKVLPEFMSQGDELKDEIIADILGDLDSEPLVILDDADDDDVIEDPDDYPFKCDECDRAFASKRGLKSHKRSHKSE